MTSAAAPRTAVSPADESGLKLSLDRLDVAGLDRLLPRRGGPFVAVALGLSVACWLAALALAHDRERFLASREWQIQPLYLAVHLVVLRLFVTAYAGGYLTGCRALVMDPADAERRARRVLGPLGIAIALVLAAPLVALDLAYLGSEKFESATSAAPDLVGPADRLLVAMWCVEWLANTYVWVVIGGFLVASMDALAKHEFRDPVMRVLRERQYRPFLLMSSRGATIVLGFSGVCALYVLYATGAMSDYIGLWVTAGLLLLAFVPPWMRLRAKITTLVRAETDRLGHQVEEALTGEDGRPADPSRARTVEELGDRVHVAFAFLRLDHLERLHADMGKAEAQAIVLRLLAPLATAAARILRGGL